MTSLAHSTVFAKYPQIPLFSGSSLRPLELSVVNFSPINLSARAIHRQKASTSIYTSTLKIRAGYCGDGGRQSNASIFFGGFVLGGIIVGALGWVYAPKISNALDGADKKDLMRKLPKFIYDEEKALERTRKILTDKIAQLNSAIDGISVQPRADRDKNEVALNVDEVEAAI